MGPRTDPFANSIILSGQNVKKHISPGWLKFSATNNGWRKHFSRIFCRGEWQLTALSYWSALGGRTHTLFSSARKREYYFLASLVICSCCLRQCWGTVTIFYGSGFDFWQVTVSVPVPALYLDHKSIVFHKTFGKNLAFLHSKLFYNKKIDKFIKFIVKYEWKKW